MVPDVVLVPVVAFHPRTCHRVGYGGGYYDRTLESLRKAGEVLAIGLAFECQADDRYEPEPHDAPLDFVVSQLGSVYKPHDF